MIDAGADRTRVAVAGGTHLTIASLVHDGRERLLGPDALPPQWRVHGERAGITFLHPWANRVTGPPWDDLPQLPRDPNGIAIHGFAGAWDVHAPSASTITARHAPAPAPAFPYAHRIEIAIAVTPGAVVIDTALVAASDEPVPAVFGWHPYFDAPGTPIALPARAHLALDERQLPTGTAAREPVGSLGRDATLDEAYADLDPGATLATGDVAVRLDHGYPAAQVFAPAGSSAVSLEPMAAPTGALATGGFATATPDRPHRARFTIVLA